MKKLVKYTAEVTVEHDVKEMDWEGLDDDVIEENELAQLKSGEIFTEVFNERPLDKYEFSVKVVETDD